MLEGRKADPRFYPVIFGLPDQADWTDEQNWYKANLDQTISIEKVRDAYHNVMQKTSNRLFAIMSEMPNNQCHSYTVVITRV